MIHWTPTRKPRRRTTAVLKAQKSSAAILKRCDEERRLLDQEYRQTHSIKQVARAFFP